MPKEKDLSEKLMDGLGHNYGKYSKVEFSKKVKLIVMDAERGVPEAQCKLAMFFETIGENDQGYSREALKLYRLAAETGLPEAQYRLWMAYQDGLIVEENFIEAVKWLRRAAERGHVFAQFSLADLYTGTSDEGLPMDLAESAKWSLLAAEQGYVPSQFRIGQAYMSGQGVPKDEAKAATWFRRCLGESPIGEKEKVEDIESLLRRAKYKSFQHFMSDAVGPNLYEIFTDDDLDSNSKGPVLSDRPLSLLSGRLAQDWGEEGESRALGSLARQAKTSSSAINKAPISPKKALKRKLKKAGRRR
ncbi:MAG: sel1 repeat family protein [Deltaproteobacteria bacterium]|nr:sel1 repeat family protein [Deltaproteobacteria bacterium]